MKSKRGIVLITFGLFVFVGLWLFFYTGGVGLVRLYRNYLSQNIPDKKYGWQDFTDRGARETLSGYYAGRVGESVFVWTLSGLKWFVHREGTSVYYYQDVCGMMRRLTEAKASGATGEALKVNLESAQTLDINVWSELAKRGDYVWVKRVGEGAESREIDKISASSNQYYPITQVREGLCRE